MALQPRYRDLLLNEAVRLGATADPLNAAALFRRLPVMWTARQGGERGDRARVRSGRAAAEAQVFGRTSLAGRALLAIETDPDPGIHHRIGEQVELHSARDVRVFYLLNILRALRPPEQVEALLRARPELVTAARIYPLGIESLPRGPAYQTTSSAASRSAARPAAH